MPVSADAVCSAGIFGTTTSILPEFGRANLPFRSNLNLIAMYVGGCLGSFVTAQWRSTHSSYNWPFVWNAAALFAVALCGLFKFLVFDCARARHAQRRGAPASVAKDDALKKVILMDDCAD